MLKQWSQIRPGERRDTAVAFLTLFCVMAAHAVLETARDTLFLTGIPATRLPWVYLVVAAVALGIALAQARRRRAPDGRRLSLWLTVASIVTASFGLFAGEHAPWTLYALYVWSAIAVSVVVTHFFILLGDRFTVTQAKRVYTFVGTGSVAGAIAGSAIASVLASAVAPHTLVLVAAGGLLLSSVGPALLSSEPQPTTEEKLDKKAPGTARDYGLVWRVVQNSYARRVAALVITATVTFTLVDYVFKSTAVAHVAADQLAVFFARCYLAFNVVSLVVQLFVVRRVVRSLSVASAMSIVPLLLILGGTGLVVGVALIGAVAVKSIDGSLRHSLHRTLGELLYLPMRKRVRAAAKIAIDLVGQRLGQALASFLILFAVGLGAGPRQLGAAVVLVAAGWVAQAVALRSHYFGLFRDSLDSAAERSPKNFPELDISSLESVMAALNSSNDTEVRAALSFLEEQGRTRAIPGLILYHPSPPVLVDALDILARSQRVDFLHMTERLLDHEYAAVRAAALRTRMAHEPDEQLLRDKANLSCPVVRATALVGLARDGHGASDERAADFQGIIDTGSEIAREALAKAIAYRPSADLQPVVAQLLTDDSAMVVLAAIEAVKAQPADVYLPKLLPLLAKRQLRGAVRDSLVQIGEPAFDALVQALDDKRCDESVLLHVPRTLSRFEPQRSAQVLLERLQGHPDRAVRYKILRGLGRIVAGSPELSLDRQLLVDYAIDTVKEMFRLVDWRMILERGKASETQRDTEAHQLLVTLLGDKKRNAQERLFRALGLLYPQQDVGTIYRGLTSQSNEMRSSSRELLESFLRPLSLRTAVLGLVDDAPDRLTLEARGTLYQPDSYSYDQLLIRLLEGHDEALGGLAVYQIGELKLEALEPHVASIDARDSGFLAQIARRTQHALSPGVKKSLAPQAESNT